MWCPPRKRSDRYVKEGIPEEQYQVFGIPIRMKFAEACRHGQYCQEIRA